MRRFRFRLDQLLNIRSYREREWELKLADVSRACLALDGEIRGLIAEKVAEMGVSIPSANRGQSDDLELELDMSDFLARGRYVLFLDRKIDTLTKELVVREAERDEVRQKYLDASRARKVLDKLKERREKDHYRESLRNEANVIDDVGAARATRGNEEGENDHVRL